MSTKTKNYIIGILIPLAVGGLAALLTMGGMDVYSQITKPPLSPPGFLFPIVWTILYTLMGISSVMIYREKGISTQVKNKTLFVYGLQLAVNFLWSMVFFNMQAYLLSFVVILVLWVLIIAMILDFKRINEIAAYLQIPYLLWVTFAAYLNLMIFVLNR